MSIEWAEEFDLVVTELRFGEYEFRAVVRPGRDEICGEVSGFAEVTASCWLEREEAMLNIAHLLVIPHLGVAPTPPCDRCGGSGSCQPGKTINDCPWCGGSGYDVVGQAQRLVEALWESARKQVLQRVRKQVLPKVDLDQSVEDHETGLEWQKEPAGPMDWDDAQDYAESLDLGGYFEKTDKGTVIDHETGLEWQAEPAGPMTWDESQEYAKDLDLGGYTDWRMPTVEELETLLDRSRHSPASSFPGMPARTFWSSSVYACDTSLAWLVSFYYGRANNYGKYYTGHVRCVRRKMKEQA